MTETSILGSRQSTCPRTGKELLKLASIPSEDCSESEFCDVLFSTNQYIKAKRKILLFPSHFFCGYSQGLFDMKETTDERDASSTSIFV